MKTIYLLIILIPLFRGYKLNAQDDFREEIRKETILNSDYIIEGTETQYYVWYNQEKDKMYLTRIVEVSKTIKGSIEIDDNLVYINEIAGSGYMLRRELGYKYLYDRRRANPATGIFFGKKKDIIPNIDCIKSSQANIMGNGMILFSYGDNSAVWLNKTFKSKRVLYNYLETKGNFTIPKNENEEYLKRKSNHFLDNKKK